ncbi:UDP-N-acetylmuramate--L-alanine ligase [Chroococcus sp. FPU101]|uniref:UDP-N-acetylmuramate--L-alanine ligase n=1 Tax=Chroococcus sp. FPU101 TaxID=1974212 RepID=UPI001A8CCE89|nr:UDP-N-acetylmuramate--L-alanine ligase [Chroococcus sp. FPU101]GFE68315.1 UDP-N-acetylmuramate/alanine ligase [Chroococcus sp. FPU101]
MKTVDFNGKPFHFIGIGGIGMSALAYILAKRHLSVSGSDLKSSHITRRLEEVGARVFTSQEASNLEIYQSSSSKYMTVVGNSKLTQPQIICSTAIHNNNLEYQAALELGYPIFHRSDVLAALIQEYQSIAVAGTHGKTTTSSLIGYMLLQTGLDPTVIIGGEVDAWDGNARVGESPYLVAEADESDGSLTKHYAKIGIVTNIELDHPDHYQNLDQVVKIFQIFEKHSEILIASLDCPNIRQYLKPQITYSLDPQSGADYIAQNITYDQHGSKAQVWEKGQYLGQLEVKILGTHNISNALAAVAVGRQLGLEFNQIADAIATFTGAKRRFEEKGAVNGITFIDDYAHHPSEIKATLAAARLKVQHNQHKRVMAIFQPHRYTRTATFLKEFGESFEDADLVILTDIYNAGETNLQNLQGQTVVDEVKKHHSNVYYCPDYKSISNFLQNLLQTGDLALFLGAGNLNQMIPETIALQAAQTKIVA